MITAGKYSFPNEVAFSQALKIAKLAIDKYDGKMSNKDVAEAMGYKIKDPKSISGYIFRKFNDMCAYNLMKRERGFISVTSTAYEALDPIDTRKAEEGKAKAIRQIRIVSDAFTKWDGEIPSETSILSKMNTDLGIQWQEAQKTAEPLRKLLIELFPYLKTVSGEMLDQTMLTRKENFGISDAKAILDIAQSHIIAELRSEDYGIIKIKDRTSVAMAKMALDSIEKKLEEQEKKTELNSEKG